MDPENPAAPEATPAAAPAAAPAAPAAAGAPALTFRQRLAAAHASIQGRGTSAEVEALRGQVAALTTDLAASAAALGTVTAERDRARAELADAEAAVTEFNQRVIDRSVEIVASAGIPVSQLPAAAAEGSGSGREEELRSKLTKTRDQKERGKILLELSSIRNWGN